MAVSPLLRRANAGSRTLRSLSNSSVRRRACLTRSRSLIAISSSIIWAVLKAGTFRSISAYAAWLNAGARTLLLSMLLLLLGATNLSPPPPPPPVSLPKPWLSFTVSESRMGGASPWSIRRSMRRTNSSRPSM